MVRVGPGGYMNLKIGQVGAGLATKNGLQQGAPEWDWVVRKVDVRGAVNIYFCLLLAERYVVNVGEVDHKKHALCPKRFVST